MSKAYCNITKQINEVFDKNYTAYINGNPFAEEEILIVCMDLVVFRANEYKNYRNSMEDLKSAGTLGLMKAIRTYDFRTIVNFAALVDRCIVNEIITELRKNKNHDKGLSFNALPNIIDDQEEMTLLDIIPSEEDRKNDYSLMMLQEQIRRALGTLPQRERIIIEGSYYTQMKRNEIAKVLGMNVTSCSRIKKKALDKLREILSEEGFIGFRDEKQDVEKTIFLAKFMISEGLTLDELAKIFDIPSDIILHFAFCKILKNADSELYETVMEKLVDYEFTKTHLPVEEENYSRQIK